MNIINWILRLFSCRRNKSVQNKRYIQYVYEHITIPWLKIQFQSREHKERSKERAKICASCIFSGFGPEREKFIFNRRLISTKSVICKRNQMDLTQDIVKINDIKCPIDKWK